MTSVREIPTATDAPPRRDAEIVGFAHAVAEDIDLLASLHDREPTAALIEALQKSPIDAELSLVLGSDRSSDALRAFKLSVDLLPRTIDQSLLDDLASAYADIYLRHHYRAAPTESVWLTEDGLERQAPMFQIREIYRRHNLRVTDWASRPEDHLVLQLRFVAVLLAKAGTPAEAAIVAQFLDDHLLRWIGRFAQRLIETRAPDFYAALALLTACYLDELRDHLADISGVRRPEPEGEPDKNARLRQVEALEERPYVPGMTVSW